MSLTPTDWNVVVLGFWNRAILTPSGIATRLFRLEEGTPVTVFVAIDAVATHQVKHDGITVVAGSDRLIVQPDQYDFRELQKAKEVADRALENLPETPVIAAGMNVKYTSPEPLDMLQQATRHEWLDRQLSDNNYEIVGRSLARSLKWNAGQINVSVTENSDGRFEVQLNFHRGSGNVADLRSWVSTPIAALEEQVKRVLFGCIQVKVESIEHAGTVSTH